VKRAYDSLEQTDKLYGRSFNYRAPLLSVCKVFASERFDELLKLAEEDAEKAEKGDRLSEVEEAVLSILLEEKTETVTVLLKELTQQVQNIVPWVKDWHIVVSALENLGVIQRKYPTSKGVQYQIKLEKVRKEAEKRRTKEEANKKVQENTSKTKASVKEVLETLRLVFVEGTEEEFLAHAVDVGLSKDEALQLFESLKGEELFWFDREGKTFWRWVHE
jgi:hypothetical protein